MVYSVTEIEKFGAAAVLSDRDRGVIIVLHQHEMSSDKKAEKSGPELDLVNAAFMYITESHYPNGCSDVRKRTIRKKAKMFVVRDGVMYFKKKKRGKVYTFFF